VDNEASGKAAVYCVIIGLADGASVKGSRRLFEYEDPRGLPTERVTTHLNFYLLDTDQPGPNKRSKPLLAELPTMDKGSQPTDGQNLIVEADELPAVQRDPIAAKFLRRFAQSGAVLDNEQRWCLWLVDSSPSDRKNSQLLRTRLEAVRTLRAASPTPSVQRAADTPWLFTQRRQPTSEWLAVPRHSSEHRICVPMTEFGSEVIAGDALSYIEGCPAWVFVYLQSSAFTAWVATFSGALESRFRISPDMTYNVFTFVAPEGRGLAAFESAANRLRSVRAAFPNETLATLYDSLAMPKEIRDAHAEIDRLVDGIYGLKCPSRMQRVVALLTRHHEISQADELPIEGDRPNRRRAKRTV